MSFGRLSRRRLAIAASAPVLLSVTLAACGGGDDSESTSGDPTDASNTAGLVSLNAEWPLTGETMDGDPPDHPVYVVKIDNTSSSAPQVGLDSADMVVEELVEGGLTRLAVFFYSDIPDSVGPVRSLRASDVGITKPVNADVVASGAARRTTAVIDTAHIQTFTESSGPGFYRDSGRAAPYNLFNHLKDVAHKPGDAWEAPTDPYMAFGSADDFTGTIPVTTIAASFSGAHTTSWQWNGKVWTRPDSNAETGHDFVADNVLMLRVRLADAGYLDPAGNPVPETLFYGKGPGLLVAGNKATKVSWSKKDKSSELQLTDNEGNEVTVPAGHTWIELVPQTTGSVQIGH